MIEKAKNGVSHPQMTYKKMPPPQKKIWIFFFQINKYNDR